MSPYDFYSNSSLASPITPTKSFKYFFAGLSLLDYLPGTFHVHPLQFSSSGIFGWWLAPWRKYVKFVLGQGNLDCSKPRIIKLCPFSQIQPIACFSAAHKLRMAFTFVDAWGKKMKRKLVLCDTLKLYEMQMSVFISKI